MTTTNNPAPDAEERAWKLLAAEVGEAALNDHRNLSWVRPALCAIEAALAVERLGAQPESL